MNEKDIFFLCVIFGFAFYICILLVLFLVIKVNSHKLWFFIFRSSDTYFQRTFYVNQHLYTHFFYAWKNERIWSKCTWAKIPINTAKCNTSFIVVLHLEVTMRPSTIILTHTLHINIHTRSICACPKPRTCRRWLYLFMNCLVFFVFFNLYCYKLDHWSFLLNWSTLFYSQGLLRAYSTVWVDIHGEGRALSPS